MINKYQASTVQALFKPQEEGATGERAPFAISEQALAHMGDGQLAYVKAIKSDEIGSLFPNAPTIAPGLELFVLLSASGTPLVIADTAETAKANAWQNDLVTVSLH
jgi:hypothetical protein